MDVTASTIEEPAAAGRRAQLLLGLLLPALLPVFLLTFPIQTHSVKLDLPRLAEASAVPFPSDARILAEWRLRVPEMDSPRRVHILVVTPDDRALLNGRELDLAGLRGQLDLISVNDGEWVDFRPEPNARYEMFFEVLALTRRARLERLRLDSRSFRRVNYGP
jgi:biopolymer transport protein ExbD